MSNRITEFSQWMTATVPIATVIASLLGSSHCVSMCGALVIASTRRRVDNFTYHLGRLSGYLTLGGAGGLMGQHWLSDTTSFRWVSLFSGLALGLGFLLLGVKVWRGNLPHFAWVPSGVLHRIFQKARGHAFFAGTATALLPCGWLHTFVLGAVATRGVVPGMILLFCFWIGTLPALVAMPWLAQAILRPLRAKMPRVSALFLIGAGLLSIGTKTLPLVAAMSGAKTTVAGGSPVNATSEPAGHHCH